MSAPVSANRSSQSSAQPDRLRKTSKEVDDIVKRLAVVDRTYQPPGSNTEKIDLGYGRYEFPRRVYPEKPQQKCLNREEVVMVGNIIDRLNKGTLPSHKTQEETPHNKSTCTPAQLDEILSRLTSCDFNKGPVESTRCRQMLGFNRYDWSDKQAVTFESKKVSKEELDDIITRLTQYDINKGPPESRGHEKH